MLNLVQTRLKQQFSHVQTAVNVRQAMAQSLVAEFQLYVVPLAERPKANERDTGKPLQETQLTFAVIIGLVSRNDSTGSKALQALETHRRTIRSLLYGWQPEGTAQPIELGPSDLLGLADNGIWWIDRFTTTTWYEGTQA